MDKVQNLFTRSSARVLVHIGWQGNKLYQNAYTIYFSRPSSLSMIKTQMAPCRNMNVKLYI